MNRIQCPTLQNSLAGRGDTTKHMIKCASSKCGDPQRVFWECRGRRWDIGVRSLEERFAMRVNVENDKLEGRKGGWPSFKGLLGQD